MALSFSVSIADPGGTYAGYHGAIAANLRAAAAGWAKYIAGSAAIEVRVEIGERAFGRADGRSETSVFLRRADGFSIYEQGAAAEARTGIDPNGATPDVIIGIDSDYLRHELWLDPSPDDAATAVPADRTDGFSILLHELGHALAFNGWRDPGTGAPPGGYMSSYDALVRMTGGAPYFYGAAAQAAYGGPVPLTRGDLTHYGNAVGPGDDLVAGGLMNGVAYERGVRYEIDGLDLAVLKDVGIALRVSLGGGGADRIALLPDEVGAYGFAGDDTIVGGAGADEIDGGDGNDSLDGGQGDDRIDAGPGIDFVRGGAGNDRLSGDAANDHIVGGAGNDRLAGGGGADELRGEAGRDTLEGGAAGDRLYGGFGADVLAGGAGADRFFLTLPEESGATAAARDVIADFEPGADLINLARIDADRTVGGNDAFGFIGTAPLTAAGQLRFALDPANGRTVVEGNVDDDPAADFRIELIGLHSLAQADFVL